MLTYGAQFGRIDSLPGVSVLRSMAGLLHSGVMAINNDCTPV